MQTITLNFPDNLPISKFDIEMLIASKLYEEGKLTSGQAAQLIGISKRAFIEVLGKYGVSVFGYDFGDNSNIPAGGLLSYHQDINDDNIPEYAMVWLGSTVSVDDTDLSNADASGDLDDGVSIAKSVVNGQAILTLNMNSNFSTTAHYLIGIDWDSDGIIDDTVTDSTPINGATSVVKHVDVPVDYITTLINFRIMISEEPLVAADISGYVEKLGEIEDYRKALATTEICNNGIDDDLDGLYDCDDDDCAGFTDCTTTATSGGNNGGLESNNRLADKIAKRYYNRYKTNTNDIKVNVAARNLNKLPKDHDIYRKSKNNNFALIDLMPKQAIENTVPFNSTPNENPFAIKAPAQIPTNKETNTSLNIRANPIAISGGRIDIHNGI